MSKNNVLLLFVLALIVTRVFLAADPDYYKVLGVKKTATQDEIKSTYKKLAMKWHPDRNKQNREAAQKKFVLIGKAYDVLKDNTKRKEYDLAQSGGPRFAGFPAGGANAGGFRPQPNGGQTFYYTSTSGGNFGDNSDIMNMFKNFGMGGMPKQNGNGKPNQQARRPQMNGLDDTEVQRIFQQLFNVKAGPKGRHQTGSFRF
jgi:DnaJ-class molecular chaperone